MDYVILNACSVLHFRGNLHVCFCFRDSGRQSALEENTTLATAGARTFPGEKRCTLYCQQADVCHDAEAFFLVENGYATYEDI